MNIDKKFYKGKLKHPTGTTVGDLIKILKELPEDLPICQDFPLIGFMTTVFNINHNDVHLGIEPVEEGEF